MTFVQPAAAVASPPRSAPALAPVVAFDHVSLAFDDNVVLRDISFSVPAGGLKVILGGSGSGKTVILKLILGFLKPDAGAITVNGARVDRMTEPQLMQLRGDVGMLFQESALFDSLTVAENVGYRLYEETDMPLDDVRHRVEEVLSFIGLQDYIDQMPSDLSGGQRRRVAIARAMASRPHLLLFDSPTSGLDPITAKTVDAEIIKLRDLERVTSIVVTHQLDDAFYIASHDAIRDAVGIRIVPAAGGDGREAEFMMLRDGGIYFAGTAAELRAAADPYLKKFIS